MITDDSTTVILGTNMYSVKICWSSDHSVQATQLCMYHIIVVNRDYAVQATQLCMYHIIVINRDYSVQATHLCMYHIIVINHDYSVQATQLCMYHIIETSFCQSQRTIIVLVYETSYKQKNKTHI